MIKRIIIGLILCAMIFHCACRIGLITYLYQQRHQIALTLGLIDDVPIAVCSHSYDQDHNVAFEVENQESQLPSALFQVREIILYFNSSLSDQLISSNAPMLGVVYNTAYSQHAYVKPVVDIFQPPKI